MIEQLESTETQANSLSTLKPNTLLLAEINYLSCFLNYNLPQFHSNSSNTISNYQSNQRYQLEHTNIRNQRSKYPTAINYYWSSRLVYDQMSWEIKQTTKQQQQAKKINTN